MVSVSVSKNLTFMLTSSMSPIVMSDGVRSVRTVTSIPEKLMGGAWSPPSPCPETDWAAAGITAMAAMTASSASLLCNIVNNFTLYLKIKETHACAPARARLCPPPGPRWNIFYL